MVTHCLHKKPKCTLKASSDISFELTYLLSKHIPEMVVNQACCAAGNSEYSNTRTRKICFYFTEKRLWINPYKSHQRMDDYKLSGKDLMKVSILCNCFVLFKCCSGHSHIHVSCSTANPLCKSTFSSASAIHVWLTILAISFEEQLLSSAVRTRKGTDRRTENS